MNRRAFLVGSAGVAALRADTRPAQEIARDEDFWREVQLAFPVDRSIMETRTKRGLSRCGGVCILSPGITLHAGIPATKGAP